MRTILCKRAAPRSASLGPWLALLMLGALAAACGGDEPASLRVVLASASATPRPEPVLALNATAVRQGGAFTARLSGAELPEEGTLHIGTHTYRMGRDIDGSLWAAVGVGIEEPPGTATVAAEFVDTAGAVRRVTAPIEIAPHDFPLDRVDLAPDVASLLAPESVAAEERLLQRTLRVFGAATTGDRTAFRMPLEGEITTAFGAARIYNDAPAAARIHHRGVDIGAEEGAPVVAAASGIVVVVASVPVRGTYVIVDHGLGVYTGYGHLLEALVTVGQAVKANDQIGEVGSTGASTGPHLHWDVVTQGVFFDGLTLVEGAISDTGAPQPGG